MRFLVQVASEFKQAGVVRLLKRHTIAQANWAVLAPMLACHVAHATDKLPPITHHLVTVNIVNDKSANTDSCSAECEVLPVTNPTLQNVNSSKVIPLFTTSIDDLLPIIRSYGDFSVQSDYEGGSAKCNSFLSSSFAQDVLGLVADCQ